MTNFKRPIIVIAGPTASGKSGFAIQLARKINGVIINADSRQVYKELLIGTARPTEIEMEKVPHMLYGHVSVKDDYNIFKYQNDVKTIIESLPLNQIPILTGGTGLYIDCVVQNYILQENDVKTKDREELELKSLEELQGMITKEKLETLNQSDRGNKRRLIRIVEKQEEESGKGAPLNHIYFVIDLPKEVLKERISTRVSNMLNGGLIEENREIREKNLNQYPALHSIGYQEFDGYFEGKKTIKEVEEEIITHTNQYAKRQRTWFKRHSEAIFTSDYMELEEASLKFINTL